MDVRRAAILIPLLVTGGLLLLASAGLWAYTTGPGVAQRISIVLPDGREADLHIQPCSRNRPGWISVWYTERSRYNASLGWIRPLFILKTKTRC